MTQDFFFFQVPLPEIYVTQDHVRDILLFFAGDRKHYPPELATQPGVGAMKVLKLLVYAALSYWCMRP
jgi:hypothetical protein